MSNWKRFAHFFSVVTLLRAAIQPATAQTRVIVRDSLGLSGLKTTCLLLGCTVQWGLGDSAGQVFLITVPSTLNLGSFVMSLGLRLGIVDAELDLKLHPQGT